MIDFFRRFKSSWQMISFPLGLVVGLLLYAPLTGGPKTVTIEKPVKVVEEVVVTKPTEIVTIVKEPVTKTVYRVKGRTELNRCLAALDTAEANRLNLKHLLDTLKPGN